MNDPQPVPSVWPAWLNRFRKWLQTQPEDKDELLQLLRQAQLDDLLSPDALHIMEGALQVAETHVRDVMIPRAQMVVITAAEKPDVFLETIIQSGHSRFPVVGENRDDVQGILLAKDLLHCYAQGKIEGNQWSHQFNLRDWLRPAVFIPESKRLHILLREFRTSRNHMAIVVDEYGGVAGLVTIEDVIEEIIGDIDDEHDSDDMVYIKPRDEGFSVRALTPIDEFNDHFNTTFSDEEFDTIGGLLLKAFGRVPKRGETLILAGFHFKVLRAAKRRIHLLRVREALPEETEDDKDRVTEP